MALPRPTSTITLSGPSRNGTATRGLANASSLAMLKDPHSAGAEAYRSLAVNLRFAGLSQALKTVAVTSAAAGDGKSTTVANLGIALAENGLSVILVDADLRRPQLHTLFGASNNQGLSTWVLENTVQLPLQDTGVDRLALLASGPIPATPTEVLGSHQFEELLERLREQADIVLFDTAPVAGLADTATLAPRVDGVVLVVGAGRTRRDTARQAREHLDQVHARILGVILTGARTDKKLFAY